MTKQIESSSEEVIQWLNKHLDDCPCDWHTNDYSEQLTVVFNTKQLEDEVLKEDLINHGVSSEHTEEWLKRNIPERY